MSGLQMAVSKESGFKQPQIGRVLLSLDRRICKTLEGLHRMSSPNFRILVRKLPSNKYSEDLRAAMWEAGDAGA